MSAECSAGYIPSGYKQTEVGVMPEDWDVKVLGSLIISLEAGVSVNSVEKEKDIYAHNASVLKTSCVIRGKFIPEECKTIVPNELHRAKVNPRKDSILISRMNTRELVGECGYIDKDYSNLFLPDRLWMTRHDSRMPHCVRWLAYLLSSNSFNRAIKDSATGTSGSMKNISKESLLAVSVPFPPKAEQEAIAEALSDADALIESLEQLIAKKRQIKQGAMQELLTGKRRLPGFSGEWEVKPLGDIAEIIMGQSPSSANYNNKGEGMPLIQGNADVLNRKTIRRVFTTEVTKRGILGDIIMSVRAPVGEVSSAVFDVCLGRGVCAIRYSNDFLYHSLISKESNWATLSKGSTFDSVNSADVKAFSIELPPTFEEQTAIATILYDMDSEITALEEKLTKARQIKQGMVQELLTGRIRLI